MNVQTVLMLLYGPYILHVLDESAAGLIGCGIALAGLILFGVLSRVYEKKM